MLLDMVNQFKIPYVGLKLGHHRFIYELSDDFFRKLGNENIAGSKVRLELDFEKKVNFFVLIFYVGGTIGVECDRCLKPFDLELLDEFSIYVKFSDSTQNKEDEGDDVLYIGRNESHIDVTQLIYEFVNLSIPVQKTCPLKEDGSSGCSKKVLNLLNKNEKHQEEESDPRWSVLNKLK